MRIRRLSALTVALGVWSCSDQPLAPESRDAPPFAPETQPASIVSRNEGPTSAEYAAAGSPDPMIEISTPSGAFGSGTWQSSGTFSFQYINSADAHLTTALLDQAGRSVNVGGQDYATQGFVWNRVRRTVPLESVISTNGHSCGLVGKARLKGNGSLTLIDNPIKLGLIWSGSVDRSAPDVTLPSCPANEPVARQVPSPLTGPSSIHPEAINCTVYVMEVSWDNGLTWTQVGESWIECD
jgi:hypothetical protein